VLVGLLCLPASDVAAQVTTARPNGANPSGRKYPPRVYQTVRLVGEAPAIDGRLDDAAWTQGEWAGNYLQNLPTEGAPPSQPTELKILWDERHVYVAIRAYDDPAKVHRYPGRRDDFDNYAGDIVGVCFDSYNDKRTGFEFDLTAGGSKIDLILGNGDSEWDTTWDAVWDGEVAHDDKGWTAEFRIPLSQLRYGPQDEQVWGMHAWRWIARNKEEDQWQLIPRQHTGRMHQLGELRGIHGLPRSRHIELLPHVLGRASSGPAVSSDGTDGTGAVGLDAKVGLASNFTLDATVNPDFGQVEADPSVINLTAYETFYAEKRPFFLEGRKILSFEVEDDGQLFYSRRIGEAPSFAPALGDGESVKMPDGTTILGAFKVTGKTDGGLSVAILQGFTQKEVVDISSAARQRSAVVEPSGSYTIGRVHQDWDKGNTSLGAMFTSTHRWVPDTLLASAPGQATTGGIDVTRYFANRAWVLEANGVVSRVSGDAAMIRALQTNAVHYFQRPDASHLGVDADRTSLTGHGGSVRFGRSESSRVGFTSHFRWYSPGLDLNDVGYLRQADVMANQVFLSWSEPRPRGPFRNYYVGAVREDHWDFDGLQTEASTGVEGTAQFRNKWSVSGSASVIESVDTRALRGGPALRLSDYVVATAGLGSDSSRRVSFTLNGRRESAREGGTELWTGIGKLRLRPSNRLSFVADASVTHSIDDLQYVGRAVAGADAGWILGRIDQKVWNLTFRANLAVTPELTIQYYGSPFVATGRYSGFKRATETLATDYEGRFHRYTASEVTCESAVRTCQVSEGGSTSAFNNPDFSVQEFRSNLVARWEWKPGSSAYVVWSQGRDGRSSDWDQDLGANWTHLWRTRPDNVFMVKLSYWFSL
jgi:hypothetical protein